MLQLFGESFQSATESLICFLDGSLKSSLAIGAGGGRYNQRLSVGRDFERCLMVDLQLLKNGLIDDQCPIVAVPG